MNTMESLNRTVEIESPPSEWERLGKVLSHGPEGTYDAHVIGDPCIVWDDRLGRYRLYYFGQNHDGAAEINQTATAVAMGTDGYGTGSWQKIGLLEYANREVIGVQGHKVFVVQDALRPNVAAKINGEYWHFLAHYRGYNKVILLAKSESLVGPWVVQEEPVIDLGGEDEFDGYNCDSPTAYWFEDRQEVLIYYKGYPRVPQPDQPHSPLGSTPAAAVMRADDRVATKLGKILSLPEVEGHWASGWMSTPQIVKAAKGGWYGIANGSVTTPAPVEEEPAMREPMPVRGGWMYTPEEWPVAGWTVFDRPFDWVEAALEAGEGPSFWKHGFLFDPDGSLYLYYHCGHYGDEHFFGQRARWR